MKPIIDTHLDLAWNALAWGRDLTEELADINRREAGITDHASRGHATVCLPEMRKGGVFLCLGTVMARVNPDDWAADAHNRLGLDHPNPTIACAVGRGQLAYYRLLEEQGQLRIIRTADDLQDHWSGWDNGHSAQSPVGLVLAMEGADSIVSPQQAQDWFDDGLRCASLVHYGRGRYAVGTGESGPLTPAGVELLGQFQRLGIILDVTHLSEPSFFQALDIFEGPVLASHNNCRGLVPGDRQFSDEQISLLVGRGAAIGVAMDAWMLHPDWKIGQSSRDLVGMEAVADHIDYICQLAGNSGHAAIGSDLDGGYGSEQSPRGLDSIADLARLAGILADRGFADADIDNVLYANWLRILSQHLPK